MLMIASGARACRPRRIGASLQDRRLGPRARCKRGGVLHIQARMCGQAGIEGLHLPPPCRHCGLLLRKLGCGRVPAFVILHVAPPVAICL